MLDADIEGDCEVDDDIVELSVTDDEMVTLPVRDCCCE